MCDALTTRSVTGVTGAIGVIAPEAEAEVDDPGASLMMPWGIATGEVAPKAVEGLKVVEVEPGASLNDR
jgi:hypothetical protein